MLTASNEHKVKLRKIKTLNNPIVDEVRAILKSGICTSSISGAYIQFESDLRIYGLWEALLYVWSYEPKYYNAGTAQKALDKSISMLK
jgi:hypothetical protein